MESFRRCLRLFSLLVALHGATLVGQEISGPPYEFNHSQAASQLYLKRGWAINPPDSAPFTIWIRINGSGNWFQFGVAGRTYFSTTNSLVTGWSGLSQGGPDVTFETGAGPTLGIEITLENDGTPDYAFEVEKPATEATVSYQSGIGSWVILILPDFEVHLDGEGNFTSEDPVNEEPDERRPAKLVIDNQTGVDHEMPWLDQSLDLKPGYNDFPYYGDFDEGGFPTDVPEDFQGSIVTDPETGETYILGRIVPGVEGPPVWDVAPSGGSVIPAGNSTEGPTLVIPRPGGGYDYVTIPPNPHPVRPGTEVPPDQPPIIPPDWTPTNPGGGSGGSGGGGGSGGAVSGGSSGGGIQGPAPGTGGNGGSGTNGDIVAGDYVAPTLGSPDEGKNLADQLKEAAEGVESDLLENNPDGSSKWKFWNLDPVGNDQDDSWRTFSINFGNGIQREFEIDEEWIVIVRAWLLFGVKLGFVWQVIKLLLR